MQASKELENDFLDPLVDTYKLACEAALDPQEIQGHRGNHGLRPKRHNRQTGQNTRRTF